MMVTAKVTNVHFVVCYNFVNASMSLSVKAGGCEYINELRIYED